MTPARQIEPGTIFYATSRCVNRSFRLAPKGHVREAIRYCLARTLQKYRDKEKIELYEFEFMSNHYHLLGRDLTGCVSEFLRDFNSLLSKHLNALRGLRGDNFQEEPGIVRLVGDGRVVEQAVYTLANPISAFLVAKARHWRGVSSRDMEYGVPVKIEKPKNGLWAGKVNHARRRASKRSGRAAYAGRSKLPEVAELVLDRPPIMPDLCDEQLRALIRSKLEKREEEVAQERQRRRIKVVGWRRVESTYYLAIPRHEEMFARKPTFAASTIVERVELAKIRRAFLKAYAIARDAFAAGQRDVVFPEGTYLMRVRFNVRCGPYAVP